jgi:hypothetical protein
MHRYRKNQPISAMTAEEYLEIIKFIGWSRSSAARWFRVNNRTADQWLLTNTIPVDVAASLELSYCRARETAARGAYPPPPIASEPLRQRIERLSAELAAQQDR